MESSFLDRKSFTTPTQNIFINKLKKKYRKQNIKSIKLHKPHFVYTKFKSNLRKEVERGLKGKNGCLQTISSDIKTHLVNVNKLLDHFNENSSVIGKPTETKPPEIMYENDGTEYYISSRTNRKRKRVDYVTLDHGLMYSEELEAPNVKKQKHSLKDSDEISSSEASEQNDSNLETNKSSSPTQTIGGKLTRRKKTKKKENQNDECADNPEKVVTCAVCNLELDFTSWSYHKQRHHNNLAWRIGETPLDLNDESLVARILGDLYKKRKPLYCEKCGVAKKSVVGFLSHKSMCLKTEEEKESIKIKCELCDRKVLPVSITTHMKFCHGNVRKDNSEKGTKLSETESESDTHSTHANNDNVELSKNEALSIEIDSSFKKKAKDSQEKDIPDFVVCEINDNVDSDESSKKICNEKAKRKKRFKVKKEADDSDFFGFEHDDGSKDMPKKETILQKLKSENQTQKVFTSLFAQIGEVEASSSSITPVERKVPEIITPRRGRHPKVINEIINNASECDSKAFIECAVCNNKMEQTNWLYHKLRRHNNLAWKVGDPPIDLNDHATVVYILNGIYKQRKPLYCEKCDTPRKSVMGYLSHKSSCQKTEEEKQDLRIKCEYCDRRVMPVSMPMHLKYCRAINEKKYTTVNFQNFCKNKRSAATKAQKFIEQFSKESSSEDVDATPYIINGIVPSSRKGKKVDYAKSSNLTLSVLRIKPFKTELKEKGTLICKFEGCTFSSESVQEFMKHFVNCAFKPKDAYFCKICVGHFETKEEVVEHISEHLVDPIFKEPKAEEASVAGVSDNESDHEQMKGKTYSSAFPFRNPRNVKFLLKSTALSYGKGKAKVFPLAHEWTKRFYEENYDLQNLFPAFIPRESDWIPVSPVLVNQYLPPLRYSCSVARKIVKSFENPLEEDYEWKTFLLFESQLFEDGSSTIFCGGPVHAMAWAPTPPYNIDYEQYLAVAVANTVETNKKCDVGIGPGLIQIWNYGVLINKQLPKSKPELVLCVAHDYGTVTAIEWCPSGCYDSNDSEKLKRLGLLAVACSDSSVYIYSICVPHLLKNRSKVYKPKPVCQLQVVSTEFFAFTTESVVPTRLSWTKARGHRFLAVGYSNGMAAIFDLCTTSELLKNSNQSDSVEVIRPIQNLKAHSFAITGIALFHLNDGRRWLMTASLDRACKFWDLENPFAPICEYKKFLLTDAIWLTNWLCSVVGPDDGGFDKLSQTCINLVGSFGVSQVNFFRSLSRVNSLSANDWNNSFLQGCTSGEVTISVHGQLLYWLDMDKREKKLKNFTISYVGLIDKYSTIEKRLEKHREEEKQTVEEDNQTDKSIVEDLQMNYNEAVDKYGLVFCDFSPTVEPANYSNLKPLPDCCRMTNLTVYPLTSVSKCSCNPNCHSYSYFACGYQAGFVKVSYCDITDR
ncbi:uncharacterized protein LOC108739711 isoform X2 [Agrilus planipennis]|uniref:Uncharacterized protein LOC108739711 isoform X2 n=1 Tax=Agrilus planipennis TaxID=224129 RepID=A0A1W4X8R6_AGRPL|nr:uncharacterized protein LOC108739711 isoform X2 [Agrilus planipennis]